MHIQTLTYQADGLEMHSDLYRDEAADSRPGVLVFPEAYGLGDHARGRAQRLAEMGCVALACDLHGKGTLHQDLQTAMPLIGVMMQDPLRTRARAQGALDALLAQENVDKNRIGAIGFCFGGTMALELARSGAALAAVMGFHSGLHTQRAGDAAQIRARIVVAIGADDPLIDAAQRAAFEDEMRAGKVDWQMHLYGGVVHSFTNQAADRANRPEMIRYNATADTRSWQTMRALFAEAFAQGVPG